MGFRVVSCLVLSFTAVSCRKHRSFEPPKITVKDEILLDVDEMINNFAEKQNRMVQLLEKLADLQRKSVDGLFDGLSNMWIQDQGGPTDLSSNFSEKYAPEHFLPPPPLPPLHRRRRRHHTPDSIKDKSDYRRRPSKRPRLSLTLPPAHASRKSYPVKRNNNANYHPNQGHPRRAKAVAVDPASADDFDLVEPARSDI